MKRDPLYPNLAQLDDAVFRAVARGHNRLRHIHAALDGGGVVVGDDEVSRALQRLQLAKRVLYLTYHRFDGWQTRERYEREASR